LFDLLYGSAEVAFRFEGFAKVLEQMDAATWPIATYFLFLRFPDRFLFLKPTVTQEAAEILGQEINYRPEPNWVTYSQVIALGDLVAKKLNARKLPTLSPRDMIDVQSFIWVISPSYCK
jgi:hypothetical protein